MYKIIVKGLKIFAYHGVHDQEKQSGQNFILDVTAFVESDFSDFNDNISSIVNYSELAEFSKKIILSKKYNLIETVANVLAKSIINEFNLIKKVRILLKKPNTPNLNFKYMAVELEKER